MEIPKGRQHCGSDSEKCELVTPILHYSDIETLQEFIRQLRHAGAKSQPWQTFGTHQTEPTTAGVIITTTTDTTC